MTEVVFSLRNDDEEVEIVLPRAALDLAAAHTAGEVDDAPGDVVVPGIGGPVGPRYAWPRFYRIAIRDGAIVRVEEIVASAFEALDAAGGYDLKAYERRHNREADAKLAAAFPGFFRSAE